MSSTLNVGPQFQTISSITLDSVGSPEQDMTLRAVVSS